jgi:MYXO-CTERM domain-containing protein
MKAFRVLITAALLLLAPRAADAFCGFYVAGSGDTLTNNATQVVMMREGKTTVLSMQNNYQGPPADFAMVVPVPVILEEDNVKTLPADIFAKVDRLAAPRLVEYWEQDPCAPPRPVKSLRRRSAKNTATAEMALGSSGKDLGVTVEAQFTVGEYEIVILSAKFSTGLETWLKQEKYSIPSGAEKYLRPYVASGSKFFVAKVNSKKVKFEDGRAMLSPLRFHYDSESFNLPVRLGLMNSQGHQDLIVHILAQGKRYDVANYPNVTIPTNLNVRDSMRDRFGEFYAALFDSTLEKNPKAVVTEYSWSAASCDPCPTPPLSWSELTTLGYDVVGPGSGDQLSGLQPQSRPGPPMRRRRVFGAPNSFVLTRLHARYSKDDLGEDLVFKEADPIVGGREFMGANGKLEESSRSGHVNNFQARYAIRHEWEGDMQCENPVRGIWGGPPGGHAKPPTKPATDLAFAARGKIQLASVVPAGIPELGLQGAGDSIYGDGGQEVATGPKVPTPLPKTDLPPEDGSKRKGKSKEGCSVGGNGAGLWFSLLVLGLLWRRRRRG